MRKAWTVAWREIVDTFSDRGALLRSLFFAALPVLLLLVNRGGRPNTTLIVVFAVQAALLPAASAVNAAAGSFAGEKEAQTLIPLLAAPIRDVDIVAGKFAAAAVPATVLSWIAMTVYYVAARGLYGATLVAAALPPTLLFGLAILSFLVVLTLTSVVMVASARVSSQRAAQQIGGFVIAGFAIAFGGLIGGILGSDMRDTLLIVVPLGLLVLDVIALELARRLWDREEAVARA
ncbi:MAG: ABC transporter permease subunit [Chloroflexota bacterium]|nr:ABC transporter permease subunit [Chloroflexota bacterium]